MTRTRHESYFFVMQHRVKLFYQSVSMVFFQPFCSRVITVPRPPFLNNFFLFSCKTCFNADSHAQPPFPSSGGHFSPLLLEDNLNPSWGVSASTNPSPPQTLVHGASRGDKIGVKAGEDVTRETRDAVRGRQAPPRPGFLKGQFNEIFDPHLFFIIQTCLGH